MEMFFRPQEFERLYNCTSIPYQIEDIPLEKRQDVVLGLFFIFMYFIFQILYIPCIFSIYRHMNQPCYKIMFYIGILDVATLNVNCLLTGYLGLTGAVYCSHPLLIYVAGIFGVYLWVIESSGDIILAINRCIEMISPSLGHSLFKGNRTWYWLIIPNIYGLYFLIHGKPVLFSGLYFSWFFNPHVGYIDDFGAIYYEDWHTFHNLLVFFSLTGAYTLFAVVFAIKTCKLTSGQSHSADTSTAQKMTFIQVVSISAVNAIAALIYIYMQFVRISPFLIVLAQFLWVQAHGLPCIIYLTMNKTIRRDVLRMIFKALNMEKMLQYMTSKIGPSVNGNGHTGTVNRTAGKAIESQRF